MSRKFRWFLLASCVFVVLMGAGDTIALLAEGPQTQGPSPERKVSARTAVAPRSTSLPTPGKRNGNDGELARGNAQDR